MEYPELTHLIRSLLPENHNALLADRVIPSIVKSIDLIAKALKTSHHVAQIGSANAFGDDQLNVDVLAEKIIRTEIAQCPAIVTASSEEDPHEVPVQHDALPTSDSATPTETYTIAFDPLDGSSIIPANWTVGTIVGIWTGDTALHCDPAAHQVAAVIGLLGPRTTALVALRRPDGSAVTFEVGLGGDGAAGTDVEVIHPQIVLVSPPFKTRYFAPANLRAAAEDERYFGLVTGLIRDRCTLRYSGGLVPDVAHILTKRQGLYVSPVTGQSRAKLRRLFELCPVALVVEGAGGEALDPATGRRILGTAVEDTDERAGLICGTSEEVERAMELLQT